MAGFYLFRTDKGRRLDRDVRYDLKTGAVVTLDMVGWDPRPPSLPLGTAL